MRKTKPELPLLEAAKTTVERYLAVANRYFTVWPREGEAVRARHQAEGRDILRQLGSTTLDELRAQRKDPDVFTGQSTDRKVIIARAFEWMDLEAGNYGGPLGRALFDDFMPSPIATESELEALENATDEELATWYPVALARGMERTYAVVIISPGGYCTFDAERSGDGAARDSFRALVAALDDGADATSPQVRALHRTYARDVWLAWNRNSSNANGPTPEPIAIPTHGLRQQTYQEIKRVNQGLADGPRGANWNGIMGQFALTHTLAGALHNLRIDGGLIPEWWGRPTDNESLLAELRETGLHGIATLEIVTALLVKSRGGLVDVEIDELISRISIRPRLKHERIEARILVWQILTILGATNVVGQRRITYGTRSLVRKCSSTRRTRSSPCGQ